MRWQASPERAPASGSGASRACAESSARAGPPSARCGAVLASCAHDQSAEALESLGASAMSPRYQSGFCAAEESTRSPLWTKTKTYCRVPDHEARPNCRIVLAVDVTVRVLAVRPDEDRAGAAVGPRRHPRTRPREPRRSATVRPGRGFAELPECRRRPGDRR
jgi:hypothetical protein